MREPQVGDWVRFYIVGRLWIGEVMYMQRDVMGRLVLDTDMGEVSEGAVLEVRSKEKGDDDEDIREALAALDPPKEDDDA